MIKTVSKEYLGLANYHQHMPQACVLPGLLQGGGGTEEQPVLQVEEKFMEPGGGGAGSGWEPDSAGGPERLQES